MANGGAGLLVGQPVTVWRAEWIRVEEIWLGPPLAHVAARLRSRHGVPVTVVATGDGLAPLESILDAVGCQRICQQTVHNET